MANVDSTALAETDEPGTGARRAAAVVLALGPELSANVLKHLDEDDMRALAAGAKTLRDEQPQTMNASLRAFVDAMGGFGTDMVAGSGLLHDLLTRALGIEAADRAFAEVKAAPPPDVLLQPLENADPDDLALLLSKEKPQVTALVLSAMNPEFSTRIYQNLPPDDRARVVQRVARIESVAPEVLEDVVSSLVEELNAMGSKTGRRKLDGKSAAIEILRRVPGSEQAETMDEIEQDDPDLADTLRGKLFTFEDLTRLVDRDVQQLLKEVDVTNLTVALKSASDAVKQKVLKNMSGRVAQMLLDDLENLGPVRLSDVETAQEELVRLVLDLSEQGKITVPSGDDEML